MVAIPPLKIVYCYFILLYSHYDSSACLSRVLNASTIWVCYGMLLDVDHDMCKTGHRTSNITSKNGSFGCSWDCKIDVKPTMERIASSVPAVAQWGDDVR